MSKRIGRNDIVFVSLILGLGLIFCVSFYLINNSKGNYAVVTVDGQHFGKYLLSEDTIVNITNNEGSVTNVLTIEDGKAYIIEADCPDGICRNHKPISLNHQTIVCLPNKVVVEIESALEDEVDAVTN